MAFHWLQMLDNSRDTQSIRVYLWFLKTLLANDYGEIQFKLKILCRWIVGSWIHIIHIKDMACGPMATVMIENILSANIRVSSLNPSQITMRWVQVEWLASYLNNRQVCANYDNTYSLWSKAHWLFSSSGIFIGPIVNYNPYQWFV